MNWPNDVRAADLAAGSYLCDNDIDMHVEVDVMRRPTASAFGCYRCSRFDSNPVGLNQLPYILSGHKFCFATISIRIVNNLIE